jgi:serine/threonine protein kinase
MHVLVAIKTIANTPPNEASDLNYIGSHENVIRLYTTIPHPTETWRRRLVFEYCLVGDLVDYTYTLEGPCSEMFLWHIFRYISSGLAFLHKRGVVHGDIKAANILLTTPRSGSMYPLPRIADLGSAAIHPLKISQCAMAKPWVSSPQKQHPDTVRKLASGPWGAQPTNWLWAACHVRDWSRLQI